jgi:hypothetical protein
MIHLTVKSRYGNLVTHQDFRMSDHITVTRN